MDRRGRDYFSHIVDDKLYHIMLYRGHPAWLGFELTTLVVIDTDCTGSCKSNYHTITTTSAPLLLYNDNVIYLYCSRLLKVQIHCGLFVGGLVSYVHYLYLFRFRGVQHMLPVSLDCPFWLPFRYSLTFIYLYLTEVII
jgi:hypothetical protein